MYSVIVYTLIDHYVHIQSLRRDFGGKVLTNMCMYVWGFWQLKHIPDILTEKRARKVSVYGCACVC